MWKSLALIILIFVLIQVLYRMFLSGMLLQALWQLPLSPYKVIAINSSQVPKDILSTGCDPSLWKHVYDPGRLYITLPCASITGVVDAIETEVDGDGHVLIKLDPQYQNLVDAFNKIFTHGDLLGEVICHDKIDEKEALDYCGDYISDVKIPVVGSRVKMSGSYILDISHAWMEIHPVSSIEAL